MDKRLVAHAVTTIHAPVAAVWNAPLDSHQLLRFTHFSPLSGVPDIPENYHTVTIELAEQPNGTRISLSQDNNAAEQEREYSEKNWNMVLAGLKTLLEK